MCQWDSRRGTGDSGGSCEPPESCRRVKSVSSRSVAASTAWAAAVARTTALPLALAVALTIPLAVALASAPAFALTLADTRAAVHASAAICLLAGLLAGGTFFVGLRRSTVSSAAAIRAALGQCCACGQ